jgi:hypothetical protein
MHGAREPLVVDVRHDGFCRSASVLTGKRGGKSLPEARNPDWGSIGDRSRGSREARRSGHPFARGRSPFGATERVATVRALPGKPAGAGIPSLGAAAPSGQRNVWRPFAHFQGSPRERASLR